MFRINNLANYLKEISPLLSQRISKSPIDGWSGCFAIKGSRLKASMIFDGNGIIDVIDSADESADILLTADDRIITDLVSSNCDVWTTYRQNLLTTRPSLNERLRTFLETMFPILPCRMGGWW